MAIDSTDLTMQQERLEQAAETFHRTYQHLFDQQGAPRYQPGEHQRKEREISGPLEAARERALEMAGQAEQEIARALTQLDHSDPLASLKGDDLTRASALLPLVKEDRRRPGRGRALRACRGDHRRWRPGHDGGL